jgi:hypothetical protein
MRCPAGSTYLSGTAPPTGPPPLHPASNLKTPPLSATHLPPPPAGIELLKETSDVIVALNLTPEQLNEKIKEADALIVRSATKVRSRPRPPPPPAAGRRGRETRGPKGVGCSLPRARRRRLRLRVCVPFPPRPPLPGDARRV